MMRSDDCTSCIPVEFLTEFGPPEGQVADTDGKHSYWRKPRDWKSRLLRLSYQEKNGIFTKGSDPEIVVFMSRISGGRGAYTGAKLLPGPDVLVVALKEKA